MGISVVFLQSRSLTRLITQGSYLTEDLDFYDTCAVYFKFFMRNLFNLFLTLFANWCLLSF